MHLDRGGRTKKLSRHGISAAFFRRCNIGENGGSWITQNYIERSLKEGRKYIGHGRTGNSCFAEGRNEDATKEEKMQGNTVCVL